MELMLMEKLITSSQKAANIAKLLREKCSTFSVLVENKASNSQFENDYKTLGDVLIQNLIKKDILKDFPNLEHKIHGEENTFLYVKNNATQQLEQLEIEIKETEEKMVEFLMKITNDEDTAKALANEIYKNIQIDDVNTKYIECEFPFDIRNVNIWIDPIDATNQYVKAPKDKTINQFYLEGLGCVTVLIGAYDNDGKPIMGVINQPFHKPNDINKYECYWGVNFPLLQNSFLGSDKLAEPNLNRIICVTQNEDQRVLKILEDAGWKLVYPKGAGFKLLMVILGFAEAYVVSKPTTYHWDTCGPHAILRSIGGNIISAKDLFRQQKLPINYVEATSNCNERGIVAYRNEATLKRLLNLKWPEEFAE